MPGRRLLTVAAETTHYRLSRGGSVLCGPVRATAPTPRISESPTLLGAAVTGALLAETKLAQAGLGYLAISYYGQFRIAEMYSVFLLIFLIAAAINWGMNVVLGRLTPHRRASYDHALFF